MGFRLKITLDYNVETRYGIEDEEIIEIIQEVFETTGRRELGIGFAVDDFTLDDIKVTKLKSKRK